MIRHILFLFYIFQLFHINVCEGSLQSSGLSCTDIRLIVNKHNYFRRKVAQGKLSGQPKASNIQKLVWDNKLQKLAQRWADKKQYHHNSGRSDARWQVGENLYMSWSTDLTNKTTDWAAAMDAWYDEHKLYKYQRTISDPSTGHYTQVIWYNTMYLGCGFSMFKKDNNLHKYYVCNYGPSGNYLGEYPYSIGPGCEELCCTKQCNNKKMYGTDC